MAHASSTCVPPHLYYPCYGTVRECHYLKRTKKTSKIENLHCSLGLLPQTMMVSNAGYPVFQYCAKLKPTKIVRQQRIYSLRGGKGGADAPIASPSLRAWVREHRFRTPSFELTDIGTERVGPRKKKRFRSLGTQYGRRVVKAYCCLIHLTFFVICFSLQEITPCSQ